MQRAAFAESMSCGSRGLAGLNARPEIWRIQYCDVVVDSLRLSIARLLHQPTRDRPDKDESHRIAGFEILVAISTSRRNQRRAYLALPPSPARRCCKRLPFACGRGVIGSIFLKYQIAETISHRNGLNTIGGLP
jgi:hypothetical protein